MKNASKKILENMPFIKTALDPSKTVKLEPDENVFLQLVYFFENPKTNQFNLQSIYNHLDNDWLEFALECIHTYFLEDTYLVTNPTHSLVTNGDYYMGQTRFAEFLNENGLPFDRSKMSKYITRGKVPKPDLVISGVKYWERSTCEKYLHDTLQIDN